MTTAADESAEANDKVEDVPVIIDTALDEIDGGTESQVASTLPSRATTPGLPALSLPDKVKEVIERKASTSNAETSNGASTSAPSRPRPSSSGAHSDQAVIIGLAVVDFNHLVGPQVEYAHPKEMIEDEGLLSTLPFLALPDGSHKSDEDFCYFHLICEALSPHTIFGISCNRQIASDKLAVRGKEVTRSTVQKAVVVLARDPVFGPIKEKLGVVTRAFFAQRDFADVDILVEFHATLEAGLRSARAAPSLKVLQLSSGNAADVAEAKTKRQEERQEREASMYMGTSLRELIYKWRFKTLMLLKLLLLQRKIMFFGYPVERLCTYQYSLISLIPDLLFNLADAGSPTLDKQTSRRKRAESLKTSDRESLMRFMGFPLHLFGQGCFFQPYLPLQQLDVAAKSDGYLVGTTNSIFRMQKECAIDVIVDLENSGIEFIDPDLQALVNLTPADRKWMDEVVHVVMDTWNPDDPSRPNSMQFEGSDDHLRAKFEEYICALLSSIKYSEFGASDKATRAPDSATLDAFGQDFVAGFRQTRCFRLWNATTDVMVCDLFEHKHPCEGRMSTLEDVSLRLTSGIYDMHLDEKLAKNLGPTREAVSNALNEGGRTAWRYANKWGQDLARIRREQLAQKQAAAAAAANNGGTDGASAAGSDADAALHAPEKGIHHVSSAGSAAPATGAFSAGFLTPAQQQAGAGFQRQAQEAASQAAAQAGTQVRAALSGFGSFLSSRQKAWTAPPEAGTNAQASSSTTSDSTAATNTTATSESKPPAGG